MFSKKICVLFVFLFVMQIAKSQCFEIESILVDACDGSNEGQNEMVTFRVGNTALNTSNLTVTWPANQWRGICQNASTAADVAQINATIVNCGYLKEPQGGVLPANSKVLLVTGTSWNPLAQSFANLSDTLYIIFQCFNTGNTGGHFANYASAGGLRTLTMSFSSPGGCSDAVTYDRGLLVNQSLVPGAQDGGAVEFINNTVKYVNNGCQAPYIPLVVDAGSTKTVCVNGTQSFSASVTGSYTSLNWSLSSNATGTLTSVNSVTTSYVAGATDVGSIKLYCTVLKSCGTQTFSVKDSVSLMITPLPTVTISPNSAAICPGQTVALQATANTSVSYNWTGGLTSASISVNNPGTYTCVVSNSCGSATGSVVVALSSSPSLSITPSSGLFCEGTTMTLSLSGSSGTYSWSTGASTSSIAVINGGVYTASVSNSCGQASSSINLNTVPIPTVAVSPSSNVLCPGYSATFTASSNMSNYQWSTGATSSVITPSLSGVYTVSVSNACGSATASAVTSTISFPPITLTASSLSICANETATLTVSGGVPLTTVSPLIYNWSNSSSTGSVVTTNGGTITVSNTNVCDTKTASIVIDVITVDAALSANPTSGVKPLVVNFTNNSTGANSYVWTFGNGNSASTQTVSTQTYTNAGVYTVYLLASNGSCADLDSVLINVLNEEPGLIIPNVFTPNGDSANDVFKVKAFNITSFNCMIYDRWGIQMFEWNDVNKGWDGKTDGKEVPTGTYFYIITAKDINDKEIKKQGSVNLFR